MGLVVVGVLLFLLSFVLSATAKQMPDGGKMAGGIIGSRLIGIFAIVGGVIWASAIIVPAGHRGVLLRFGAVSGQRGEGFNVVVPGMETIVPIEVRTQKEESVATAASKDLQAVTTRLALNFRPDAEAVETLFKEVGTDYKSRIIDPAVQESVKQVTSQYTAEELIRRRPQVKNEVESEITRRLRAYNIIVEPSGLSITDFSFSEEFNKAIEAKQVAQQSAEKQKYVLQQAELQKQTEIATAQGRSEAAKLNAAALQVQGGSLVIAREWIEKWDGKLPSVSAGGGQNGGGFILDLNTLMQQGNR